MLPCFVTPIWLRLLALPVKSTNEVWTTIPNPTPTLRTLAALYGPLTPPPPGAPPAPPPPLYAAWNESRRLAYRRRSVRDTWLMMLCELPGFGQGLAQKVIAVFPTPRSLFDAFEAAIRGALAGGGGGDGVGAARRVLRERAGLSAPKAAQVYDELFANGWHV